MIGRIKVDGFILDREELSCILYFNVCRSQLGVGQEGIMTQVRFVEMDGDLQTPVRQEYCMYDTKDCKKII